jgi:dolichol kinase
MNAVLKNEIKRKSFHLLLLIYAFGYWFLDKSVVVWGLLIALAVAALFEITRFRFKTFNRIFKIFFRGLYRPQEANKTSALLGTLTGALLPILFLPDKNMVFASFLYLAFGDSVAALVGKAFGKNRMPHGKSLEGSGACFAACFVVGLFLFNVKFALLGALIAAIVEVMPWDRLPLKNDNFWMQIINAVLLTVLSLIIPWSK